LHQLSAQRQSTHVEAKPTDGWIERARPAGDRVLRLREQGDCEDPRLSCSSAAGLERIERANLRSVRTRRTMLSGDS